MIRLNEHRTFTNEELAAALDEIANLLQEQGANRFRVRAYRLAADTLRSLRRSAAQIVSTEGAAALVHLPGIGQAIARAIEQLVGSGHLPLLDRLRGEDEPERVFATVPDIGQGLARRIHEHLGIETLVELEAAARDGRLAQVPGMGCKRIRAVRESLAGRFALVRHDGSIERSEQMTDVPIAELLEVDAQYRRLAKQDKLPRIAPRRFNPTHAAWLPVLHTRRDDRHYTALFSNTVRAHEMGTTHNWVVIYRDDHEHGRWTVITAKYGALRGHRIVRGRENDCKAYFSKLRNRPPKQRKQ